MFPTAVGLDQDLGSVGILLDSDRETSNSMEFSDYFPTFQDQQQGDSGDVTPVSGGSEAEFNTNDATAGSTADCDVTVTEDVDFFVPQDDNVENNDRYLETTENIPKIQDQIFLNSSSRNENNFVCVACTSPKAVTTNTENINLCRNILHEVSIKHVENIDRGKGFTSRIYNEFDEDSKCHKNFSKKTSIFDKDIPSSSKNISSYGSDKWCRDKEKFLGGSDACDLSHGFEKNIDMMKNLNVTSGKNKVEKELSELSAGKVKHGAVKIKECYIEPPQMTRLSKSFHGKSPTSTSFLDISGAPRRASEGVASQNPDLQFINLKQEKICKNTNSEKIEGTNYSSGSSNIQLKKKVETQRNPRFITTLVDEATHAASVQNQERMQETVQAIQLSMNSESQASFFIGDTRIKPSSVKSTENAKKKHSTTGDDDTVKK